MTSEDQYCFDLVRTADKDRYLASLFAPENKRSDLLALYAFNTEITRIRDAVSEPHLGEIRLQWWLDTLDGIYEGETQEHPTAIALARVIKAADLPKHALKNLANAHVFDFYSDPMPSFIDLEGYLGETSSALIQMASLVLAGDDGLENAEASGFAGVAYGLALLLQSLPLHQRRRQCFLPLDMLTARDLAPDTLSDLDHEAALGLVISELRLKASERLQQARQAAWTIKLAAQPAFLNVALTETYLDAVARAGVSALHVTPKVAQWRKQWILWKAARTDTF